MVPTPTQASYGSKVFLLMLFRTSEVSAHSWSSDWGRRAARKFKWEERSDEAESSNENSNENRFFRLEEVFVQGLKFQRLKLRRKPESKPKWKREAIRGRREQGCRAWGTIWRRRSLGSAAWSPNSPPDPRAPLEASGRCRSTPPLGSSTPSPRTHPFHTSGSLELFTSAFNVP